MVHLQPYVYISWLPNYILINQNLLPRKMRTSPFHKLILLAILLVPFLLVGNADSPPKVTVNITNSLPSNKALKLHCRSKEHDYGIKVLENKKSYALKFDPSSVKTTTVSCDFVWDEIIHGYPMYDSSRDTCKQCNWIIRHSEAYEGIVPCMQKDNTAAEPHCFYWEI